MRRNYKLEVKRWKSGKFGVEVSGLPGDGAEMNAEELRELGVILCTAADTLDKINTIPEARK